ncbi:hypothetical protein N0V82_010840, partial [Gnomoniopsis sp. IMI 355080]
MKPPSAAESRPDPSQSPKPSVQEKQPENQNEGPPSVAEPATPSSAPDTRAPEPKVLAKDNAKTTKPGRVTVDAEPTPTAEALTSDSSSTPSGPSLPTPLAETVTPSIEIDEASSAADPTTKAKGKANAKPRKPAAPKQPRKRKAAAIAGEGETGDGAEGEAGPAKKAKAPRKKATKKKVTRNGPDGQPEAEDGQDGVATTPRRRSQRSHKTAVYAEKGGQELETGTDNEEGDYASSDTAGSDTATAKKSKKSRRKRSVTPEDAENIQIDPQTITLAELTRNMRTGKRWEKAHLIEQVEQERKREIQKRRLIKLGKLKEGEELPNELGSEADGTPVPGESSTPGPVAPPR